MFFGGDNLASLPYPLILGPDTLIDSSPSELLFVAKYQYNAISCDSTLHITQTFFSPITISIYPVPVISEFIIHSDELLPTGSTAELYDIAGRLMQIQQFTGNNTVMKVVNYPRGIYMCRIVSGENSIVVKKLVIE